MKTVNTKYLICPLPYDLNFDLNKDEKSVTLIKTFQSRPVNRKDLIVLKQVTKKTNRKTVSF